MASTTLSITEVVPHHQTPSTTLKATATVSSNVTDLDSSDSTVISSDSMEESDDFAPMTLIPYLVPQYHYPYGYPINPNTQQTPIYSVNIYNLSKTISTRQLQDYIIPIIGGVYYRSSINSIHFYKQQQGFYKTATVRISGYEIAVRLHNALNGHQYEGNVLSTSFGPTTTPSPVPSNIQYYPVPTHQRSYSSSTTMLPTPLPMGSPTLPPIPQQIPYLVPMAQYEELIDDSSSTELSPPQSSSSSMPYPAPPLPPPPPSTIPNPYQFQYFQPNYNQVRYQYSPPPLQSPPNIPILSPTNSSLNLHYIPSPPPLNPPISQPSTSPPPHPMAYTHQPPSQYYNPPYQQPPQFFYPRGHVRTRSLPVNHNLPSWNFANRQPQQQSRYRPTNRMRSTNKYAPILDVSDDDEDDLNDTENIEELLDEENHTEFSENQHVSNCRLFIGNIPFTTHWRELREFIASKIPGLMKVEIPQQFNGFSKGFAIALFTEPEWALQCIKELDGVQFQGRELTVRYDRHLKYIRKYNNIQAMIKSGIKPVKEEPAQVKESVSPLQKITNITIEHDEREEDEVARELMSSLKLK